MANEYSGRHVRQSDTKRKKILKREKRLNKIGLTLKAFSDPTMNWVEYFQRRNEKRLEKRNAK